MKNAMKVVGSLLAAATVVVSTVHCAAPAEGEGATPGSPSAAGDEGGIEPMAFVPDDRCVAQIERPLPGDTVLPIGTVITLKTGGPLCPLGVTQALAYRYYVEKVDSNGNIIATRVSPQGPTEWSFTRSTYDTTNLPGPGRYRIYGFSLPRTMVSAWQANDQTARNTSYRTGNAYTRFVTTSWSTGAFGSCSAACGGGTQTRTVECKDSDGVTRPDSWCSGTKPDGSQACNTDPCGGGGGECWDPMCTMWCMPHCMFECPGICP